MDSEWSVLKKNSSLHKKTQKNSEDYSLVGELQNPLVWGSHQSWKAGDHNMAPFVLNWDFEHKRNGWEWLHMETALWSERGRAHTDSTYIPDTHTLLGWCRVRRGKKAFANTERLLATPKVRHLIPTFATVKKKKRKTCPWMWRGETGTKGAFMSKLFELFSSMSGAQIQSFLPLPDAEEKRKKRKNRLIALFLAHWLSCSFLQIRLVAFGTAACCSSSLLD